MKNIFKYALVFALVFALAGCGKSENKSGSPSEAETIGAENPVNSESTGSNLKNVTENCNADFELCQNAEYVNLDWSNASLSIPNDIGEIYDIRVEEPDMIYSDNKEFMDYFDNVSEYLFSGSESFKNKDNFRFDSNSGILNAGLYDNDNLERIKSGDIKISFLVFDTGWDLGKENDGKLLECPANGNYIKINRGNCLSKAERQTSNSGWFPQDSFTFTRSFSVSDSAKVKLEDKEVSIGEAAANCKKYLDESPFLTSAEVKISFGRILQIDNNTEGILFYPTTAYNGIPFDSMNFEGWASDFSDGNEYLFTSSQALMVRSDEVEFCFLNNLNRVIAPIEKEAQSNVSLKLAADIVSDKLTPHIKFEVLDTSLVYCVKQGANGDPNTAAVHWKFEMFNPTENLTYVAYVNVQDESFFYFKHI